MVSCHMVIVSSVCKKKDSVVAKQDQAFAFAVNTKAEWPDGYSQRVELPRILMRLWRIDL